MTVGNLVSGKGQDLVIRALAGIPDATLLVVGDGPLRHELRRLAAAVGVADRTHFLGQLDQERLIVHYNAADATILASAREGLPNVVLESLACGTPVIASSVGGIPEVMTSSDAGVLLRTTSTEAVAAAVAELRSRPVARSAVRRFAERFGWEPTIRAQLALYRRLLEGRHVSTGAAQV
jgi:teichuronic acid biosynthesis glycosyltransferase TuaC